MTRKTDSLPAAYFEEKYRSDIDPWRFRTSEYEAEKYASTLRALTRPIYSRALEGPWLIARLGLAGAATLSAGAGVLRWSVMATTTSLPALIGVQALHGLTFALMHLAAMSIIARSVPDRFAATAQTIYGAGALGIASAVMTTASGYLYGWFGMHAFWAMAALCAIALPFMDGIAPPSTATVSLPSRA